MTQPAGVPPTGPAGDVSLESPEIAATLPDEFDPESLFKTDIAEPFADVSPADGADPAALAPEAQPVPPAFESFRPAADAPQWQTDAFYNVVNDTTLSDIDKQDILKQTPHAWNKNQKWRRDSRVLGKFRDSRVPIGEVLDELVSHNQSREQLIEVEAVARVLKDNKKIVTFAEQNQELYSQLIIALVEQSPDTVEAILGKRGYKVLKSQPAGADEMLDKLKANPFYAAIEGTDFEAEIAEVLTNLSSRITDETAASEGNQQAQNDQQVFVQKVQENITRVQTGVWDRSVAEGLVRKGIKPASREEVMANPVAYLKTIIHQIGIHGLPGVIPDADSQVDSFAVHDADYTEALYEMERAIQSGDFESFERRAKTLAPIYYSLGEKRATMPVIKMLYGKVLELLNGGVPPAKAPPEVNPQTPGGTGQPGNVQTRDNGWAADRVFFKSLGK